MISVKNLSLTINNEKILDDLSFEVKSGDMLAIIGPNGAGKTMLFRALLGLVSYRGEVRWQENIKIGYVPQRLSIEHDLPLTVRELFYFKTKDDVKIKEALSMVGFRTDHAHEYHIERHLLNRRAGVLSGGEMQRVFIAWALVDHPDVLLFDEPTAGIDVESEETIYQLLRRLNEERGITILLISHDLNIIHRYADLVLCLNKKRVCFGEPKEALQAHKLKELYGDEVKIYAHYHEH